MTEFQRSLLNVVRQIPPGRVMSYGQVALYMGLPRAARQVGWALRSLEGTPDFPWWRVVNNAGRITIRGNYINSREIQRRLLEDDGIEISDSFQFDIERYRFFTKPSG
jgi:methylated-DNA-protein-cysteine methyltransferase-like protein